MAVEAPVTTTNTMGPSASTCHCDDGAARASGGRSAAVGTAPMRSGSPAPDSRAIMPSWSRWS